jgi:hypothetical protein
MEFDQYLAVLARQVWRDGCAFFSIVMLDMVRGYLDRQLVPKIYCELQALN